MTPHIKENEPLAQYSTFCIGGTAEHFTEVQNLDEAILVIEWARERNLPHCVVAGCSNVVFPDGTLPGLTIRIAGGEIRKVGKYELVSDAGVLLGELIMYANKLGYKGLETLAGIPGSVGGAVVGNAGAYGHSISEVVHHIEILNRQTSKREQLTKDECKFGYRESIFKREASIIGSVTCRFADENPKVIQDESERILAIRARKYSPELKCPGSFFKNILVSNILPKTMEKIDKNKIIEGKIPAGYLLESVGAKGLKKGGIAVSDFHANIFVNEGGGTAADVHALADELTTRVSNEFEIKLEPEVRFL